MIIQSAEPDASAGAKNRRPRPFLVLCMGFGGLLVFILAAGAGTVLILNGVRREETRTRQAFLERSLNRAEERQALSAEHLRWSLLGTFTITLLGGLALAIVTVLYTLRLERELQRRLAENARARTDLERLSASLVRAQENERRTLARELHDEVGQSLSAIFMEAENAGAAEDACEMRARIASISTLAEKTVNVVRDLA